MSLKSDIEALVGPKTHYIPDGTYYIDAPIQVPYDVAIVGQSESGVILNAMSDNLRCFNVSSPSYWPAHATIRNLTFQTQKSNVEGIYTQNVGANTFDHLIFKGLTKNIHVVGGLSHSIHTIKVEPFGSNGGGQLLFEAPGGYCQHIDIADYQTYFDLFATAIVFNRATNVTARGISLFSPRQDGILVYDDSQGVQISNSTLVNVKDGVVFATGPAASPLCNALTDVNVDQATGTGIRIAGAPHLNILGGMITDGKVNGIEIGSYPAVQNVKLIGPHLSQHEANGIVVDSNGAYFKVIGATVTGCGGAALVISGGNSHHLTVALNDFSQNNAYGLIDFSTGTPKTIKDNF